MYIYISLLVIFYVLLNQDGKIWGGFVQNWNLEIVEFSGCSEGGGMSAAVCSRGKEG